jgi:hypothetical protein
MSSRFKVDRIDDSDPRPQATGTPGIREIEVEQDVVVRLLPQEFHWVEVDAEYLGPARPRIPREFTGVEE